MFSALIPLGSLIRKSCKKKRKMKLSDAILFEFYLRNRRLPKAVVILES